MQKIRSEDIRIERLNDRHNLKSFKSYEHDLVKFLTDDALNNQEKMISVTYLWFSKKDNLLLGYITLLNDRIKLVRQLRDFFMRKGVLYSTIPSLKIGRLCVDDRFLRMGIGSLMVLYAINKA